LDAEARRLEARLQAAKTRFLVAIMAAACVAVVGVVGLLAPGKGAIIGLLALLLAAILLSYAIRQRAWRDEYGRQIEELHGNATDETERPDR
jgi:hypothetical protein